MKHIESVEALKTLLEAAPVSLAYFGNQSCSVCHATRPKVEEVLNNFPSVKTFYCPVDLHPALSGQYLIFTVPAVLVFEYGREIFRNARFIDLNRLQSILEEMVEEKEELRCK